MAVHSGKPHYFGPTSGVMIDGIILDSGSISAGARLGNLHKYRVQGPFVHCCLQTTAMYYVLPVRDVCTSTLFSL